MTFRETPMGTPHNHAGTAFYRGCLRCQDQARQDLESERGAVIAAISIYGDETLHKALDDIGFALHSTTEGTEDDAGR
jgi:hypothetical protein